MLLTFPGEIVVDYYEAQAQAITEAHHLECQNWSPPKDPKPALQKHWQEMLALDKAKSIESLKDFLRCQDDQESEALAQKLLQDVQGREFLLAEIAWSSQELINVRAMAARIFIANLPQASTKLWPVQSRFYVECLERSPSLMIRLAVLYGYAEAQNWEKVRQMTQDSRYAEVREEAFALLDDADVPA